MRHIQMYNEISAYKKSIQALETERMQTLENHCQQINQLVALNDDLVKHVNV